jgi:hypothetical protein
MIQRLRSALLVVAAASFLANGAHAITGANAASTNGGIDPGSISYTKEGGLVSEVSFRMPAAGKNVEIRLSATDEWHSCSAAGSDVRCAVSPRPITDVHRLEIQTI